MTAHSDLETSVFQGRSYPPFVQPATAELDMLADLRGGSLL